MCETPYTILEKPQAVPHANVITIPLSIAVYGTRCTAPNPGTDNEVENL